MAKRRSLCVGVPAYAAGGWETLPEAAHQADALSAVLEQFGFEAVRSDDPADFYGALRGLGADDLLVVAVVGHGTVFSDDLYAVRPDGNWSRDTRVGDWVKEIQAMPDAPRTLFLLDLCRAGVVARSWYPPTDRNPVQKTWVIAACPPDRAAYDGRFTLAVANVLGEIISAQRKIHPMLEYIPLTTLAKGVRRELSRLVVEDDAYPQEAVGGLVDLSEADASDAPPFFRNPEFQADPVQAVRRQVDETIGSFVDELDAVFDPMHYVTRAGGHPRATGMGCFTGRQRELESLARWMDGAGEGALRLVTGCPGVGKSALLGVLVCAAHPKLRKHTMLLWVRTTRQPPAENLRLAVAHARQRGNAEIRDSLARQLDLAGCTTWRDFRAAVRAMREPPLIVLDAVDEALQPDPLADDLVALARTRRANGSPACRLLVGMRPRRELPHFVALRESAERDGGLVDLDERPRDEVRQDIETYVAQVLSLSAPYDAQAYAASASAFAAAVAEVLADAAQPGSEDRWGEFLVASLYTHRMLGRKRPIADPQEAAALGSRVPCSLPDVLDLDLSDTPALRAVLTAVAHARGEGMPQEIVELLCPLFADEADGVVDVRAALDSARFYLRQTADEDSVVLYRLFHQGLADHLRNTASSKPGGVQSDILNRLRPSSGGWAGAAPYALRHAIQHADDAGRADELLSDPDFLANAAPAALWPHLDSARTEAARLTVAIYRSSAARHRELNAEGRRQILGLDAARYGEAGLADAWTAGLPWKPRWATGSQVAPAFQTTLDTGEARLTALDVTELDGRLIAVVAHAGRPPRLWDLVSGSAVGEGLGGEEALACAFVDGRVVTAHRRGVLRVWDPWTGRPASGAVTWNDHEITGVVCGDSVSGPLVVASSSAGTVRAWRLGTGVPYGEVLLCGGRVDGLVCLRDAAGPVIVTGVDSQRVIAWDLRDGAELARYETGSRAGGEGISVHRVMSEGRPGFVYGSEAGLHLLEYDVSSDGRRVFPDEARDLLKWWEGPPIRGPLVLSAVRSRIVVGCADGQVHLIDSAASSAPSLVHGSPVTAVTTARTTRGAIAVSAGTDGRLRVWDLDRAAPLGSPHRAHRAAISAMALSNEPGNGQLLLVADQSPMVLAWNPATGDRLRPLEGAQTAGPLAVWRGDDGSATAVAGGGLGVRPSAGVKLWNLSTWRPAPDQGRLAPSWPVVALASVRRGGQEVLAAGGFDGGLEVWSPDALGGLRLTDRISGDGYVHLVRLVPITGASDRPVLVSLSTDGVARVWDLGRLRRGGVPIGLRGDVTAVAAARVRHRSVALAGMRDGLIRTWDLRTGEEAEPELRAHSGEVVSLCCGRSRDGTILVSSGADATLRIWDLETRRHHHTIALPEPAAIVLLTDIGDIVAAMDWELVVWTPQTPP